MTSGTIRKSYDGVVACAAGHDSLPALFDQQRALVDRPRAARARRRAPGSGRRTSTASPCRASRVGPDTAVGLTQHFGLSPRWLDHIPFGGASGIVALRRAARAVQAGDAEFVACVAGDTNHVDSFRKTLSTLLALRAGRRLSLRLRRRQRVLRADHQELHEQLRRDARGFRQALRRAARQCAVDPVRA